MISPDDTIVAIATPLGEGGLGVVRLSGSNAFAIADQVFRSKEKLADASTHTLHHGWVCSGSRLETCRDDDVIDEAVAAVFRAPHSYTGEDVVEISCHGSPTVLKEALWLCQTKGARLAEPGEFTQRAYTNGKLDLPQAEAVADLIHAQSSKARIAAASQLRGNLSVRINGLREQLIDLLAHIEANLDFSEEEIPALSRGKISKSLENVAGELTGLLSTSVKGRLLRDGLRVTLAGKPNVGKSSLFNALLAEDRAIVTDIPGTTRDTLEEKLEWDGIPVVLTDTAGLRSTGDAVEAAGAARARRAQDAADVVFLVFDGSLPLTKEDLGVMDELKEKNVVTVLNKCDNGRRLNANDFPSKFSSHLVYVSAKKGEGLLELKTALMKLVDKKIPETESTIVVTNLRHVRHLEKTLERINAARQSLDRKESEEAVALDVRACLEELGAITGEKVTEDVLSAIFRQFCIGK